MGSFSTMTPAAKRDWASNCRVEFPCRDRTSCKKMYAASCPAGWYALNGGMSCAAPVEYSGVCAPVLHGLADLLQTEKAELESKCEFHWPCFGEVYNAVSRVRASAGAPRAAIDPARYAAANGPIDSSSGAVEQRVV